MPPYSDDTKQSAYQLRWVQRRRRACLSGKSCARCGSTDGLEIDHVDPRQKVTHRIWSWSWRRIRTELRKCQILCRSCHRAKTAEEGHGRGEGNSQARLTEERVLEARQLRREGWTLSQLAERYGVPKGTISDATRGKSWGHLPGAVRDSFLPKTLPTPKGPAKRNPAKPNDSAGLSVSERCDSNARPPDPQLGGSDIIE